MSIDIQTIKQLHPFIYKLFQALFKLHEIQHTDNRINTIQDLEIIFLSLYPNENQADLEIALAKIEREGSSAKKDLLVSYLEASRVRQAAFKVSQMGLEVADGLKSPESFLAALEREVHLLKEQTKTEETPDNAIFVSNDVEELYNKNIKQQGLRWRLDSLNKSLGSLRRGDFGFVFARPESGKTTFLCSELTHMLSQIEDNEIILWINNEEQGSKVMLRCVQAALDKTTTEITLNLQETKQKFKEIAGNKLKIYDNGIVYKQDIEKLFLQYQPKLCVIDQIDKIKGFSNDRKDLELGEIYNWARELSKQYCPIIGVCQADGTGEGVKALTMSHVSNAKTSKQAEADFILGIGKAHDRDLQYVRYFNISKNKLMGDADTDPSLRHGYWEVEIDPNRARYRDFNQT